MFSLRNDLRRSHGKVLRTFSRLKPLTSVEPTEAARFHLKTRQRTALCHGNSRSQRKGAMERLFDTSSHALGIVARNDFDCHFEVLHPLLCLYCDLEFVDGGKLANDIFNCRRINIYTTNDHHVIAAAQ